MIKAPSSSIVLASDVHQEFGYTKIENPQGGKVLVLSGDIFTSRQFTDPDESKVAREFFSQVTDEFEHVVYISGNHEFYGGDFRRTELDIAEFLASKGFDSQVHYLSRYCQDQGASKFYHIIDGWLFVGSTLWTDMGRGNEDAISMARFGMNDYHKVTNSEKPNITPYRRRVSLLAPEDTVEEHVRVMAELEEVYRVNKGELPIVFIGHHAPTPQSVAPRFARDTLGNMAYASDLTEFILHHPDILLWTHGHTHTNFDYEVGNTRVVCNPRGYIGYESQADHFNPQFIRLDDTREEDVENVSN